MNPRTRKVLVLHGLLEGDPAQAGVSTSEPAPAAADDFEAKYGLGDDDEPEAADVPSAADDEPPSSAPAEPPAPVAQPTSPHPSTPEPQGVVPPAPSTPAPVAQPPAEPPAAPPQPAAQPPQPVPAPTEPPAPTALTVEQQLAKLTEHYALSEEDAAALQTEQEVVIPKLAAKLHYNVMQDLGAWMAQAVPQMIQQYTQAVQLETKAREQIFSRWPELKDYEAQTLQAGALFRQLNPTATPEQVLEALGPIVYAGLGKPFPGASAPAAPSPATPTQPASTFMPAAPATAPAPAPAAPAATSIQSLVDDDLAEGYRPAGR